MTQAPTAAPAQGPRAKRKRSPWLLIVLAVILVLALIVGVSAIAGYFALSNRAAGDWSWQDPLLAVDGSRVRTDIAVLALLDEPSSSLVRQALAAGEVDTALALLVHSPALDDSERSGNAQLIAKAFEGELATDLAAVSLQQVQTLAALSPTMPDFTRAQTSLDAAEGFIRLDMAASAQPILRQAEVLARYSPLMAPVQRQQVALRLRDIYRQAGDETQSRALDQLVREPRGLPTNKFVRGPFLPGFVGQRSVTSEVAQAANARRQAVYTFLEAWDSGDQSQVERARQNLAAILRAEDAARQAGLATALATADSLPQRAGILQEQVDWLTMKYAIASGGLGMSIVPAWEPAEGDIWQQLGGAYSELLRNFGDQAAALSDPDDVLAANVEVLRYQTMLGRLGLLPGYDEAGQAEALRQAQEEASHVLPLLVVEEPWGRGIIFRQSESFD